MSHCILNIMSFKRCLVIDNQTYIKRRDALSGVNVHIHNSCLTMFLSLW